MTGPTFFATTISLNQLIQQNVGDGVGGMTLAVELIDCPYRLVYKRQGLYLRKLTAYRRAELQSEDATFEAGSLTFDTSTQDGNGSTKDPFLRDNMGALFKACSRLSSFIESSGDADAYCALNPEHEGVILKVTPGSLKTQEVSGRDRPDLMCARLLGGQTMMRPYFDEQIKPAQSDRPIESLTRSAENGDMRAMDQLALKYLNGDGVEADAERALYWYRKLADKGNAVGMFNLGLFYAKGQCVPRDFNKAAEWMDRARKAGDSDAGPLAAQYRSLAKAEPKAESGDAQAQAELAKGLMSLAGSLAQLGPQSDYVEALKWAEKSAEQDNPDGIWVKALAFEHGRGTPVDVDRAIRLYEKAANLGHALSQHSLACYYMRGDHVQRNPSKAFGLMLKSAEKGYGLGMKTVGRCYQTGEGTAVNLEKAILWYRRALSVLKKDQMVMLELERMGATTSPLPAPGQEDRPQGDASEKSKKVSIREAESALSGRMREYYKIAQKTADDRMKSQIDEQFKALVASQIQELQDRENDTRNRLQAKLNQLSMFAFGERRRINAELRQSEGKTSKLKNIENSLRSADAAMMKAMIELAGKKYSTSVYNSKCVENLIKPMAEVGLATVSGTGYSQQYLLADKLRFEKPKPGNQEIDKIALDIVYRVMGGSSGVSQGKMRQELLEAFQDNPKTDHLPGKSHTETSEERELIEMIVISAIPYGSGETIAEIVASDERLQRIGSRRVESIIRDQMMKGNVIQEANGSAKRYKWA